MCSCFSDEDVSISLFCHMRFMSVSHTFLSLWPKRMFLHKFWHTRQRFWKIVRLACRLVCTQVLRLLGAGPIRTQYFVTRSEPRLPKKPRVPTRDKLTLTLPLPRGQSSWSVVLRGWCLYSIFIFYGGYAHVFTKRYCWGNRGQCLDKCMGVSYTCYTHPSIHLSRHWPGFPQPYLSVNTCA